MNNAAHVKENPLGVKPIGQLLKQFAIPSIVAMLVSALYNIVDQLFIGHAIGTLGNAATNIAFPFTTSCLALALLFGIGGASCFNLNLGKGNKEAAPYFVGNAVWLTPCVRNCMESFNKISSPFIPTIVRK